MASLTQPTPVSNHLPEAANPSCHYRVIDVTGDDAAAFLHAQFTNDIKAMRVGDVQRNAWATPKGRILFAPWVWRYGESSFALISLDELSAALIKRLGMFVLRSKVKLALAGERSVITLAALTGAAAHRLDSPSTVIANTSSEVSSGRLLGLTHGRALLVTATAGADALAADLAQAGVGVDAGAWTAACIEAGDPEIGVATQDQFVPQMVNLELVGGVSFKKGCYPGQEIVARTHYLGKLKRRMVRVRTGSPLVAGMPVFSATFGNQAAGMVVLGADDQALVSAQLDAIAAGDLVSAGGESLGMLALPYAVPDVTAS